MSTCFVRSLLTPFLLTAIADWLSPWTTEPVLEWSLNSFSRPRSQRTSWIAAASAYNSASHVDSATVRCFLLDQLMGSPLSFATQPVMDFLSFLLLAQSASAKAHTSSCCRSP